MGLIGLVGFVTAVHQAPAPVLWLDARGEILVNDQPFTPRLTFGATKVRTNNGIAYSFSGERGGLLFGDVPALRLYGSMTVSTWIYPRNYVTSGPGAQILFRGDDRPGHDPFSLRIEVDNTVAFQIQDDSDKGMKVKAELPLNHWSHILASYNERTGDLTMWLNGERVATARTSHHPFAYLQPQYAPGVSVGNVQNDHGPDNEPFNGLIADLRLYSAVLTPEQIPIEEYREQIGP